MKAGRHSSSKPKGCKLVLFSMSFLIISGTNRSGSLSEKLSLQIKEFLDLSGEVSSVISLDHFSNKLSDPEYYDSLSWTPEMKNFQDTQLIPAAKLIFVIPEYNGGFPGILKLWLDVLSVRKRNESFQYKKLGLIGISEGKSSNIRGLDHFIGISRYLKMILFPSTVLIPQVHQVLEDWNEQNEYYLRLVKWLDEFKTF